MTPKPLKEWLRLLPPQYASLALGYYKRNVNVCSLPDALIHCIPWHPGGTTEGYYFWQDVYLYSKGLLTDLPFIRKPKDTIDIYATNRIYRACLIKVRHAYQVICWRFGRIDGSRKRECVYARYIMVHYMMRSNDENFSLSMLGRSIAEVMNRTAPFDHSTILHCRTIHQDLVFTNDQTYMEMLNEFNTYIDQTVPNDPIELDQVA